jgi:predicted dehydrogenase
MSSEIRVAVSGIGNRALPKDSERSNWAGWIELISKSKEFELVAAHDPSSEAIKRVVDRGYLGVKHVYTDLDRMLSNTVCDAILVANPAEYHAITIQKAIENSLHIIVEKPFVTDIEEGKKIVEAIEASNLVSCVVQNWRYKDVGRIIFHELKDGQHGRIGHVFFRYVRNRENPGYPAYIFQEPYPLLYAMGIHHLDLFMYILQDEILSVTGNGFKPPWSMYESETGVNLYIKTKSGIPIVYTGSISSKNSNIPQENMIVECEKGSLFNESQWLEPPLWFYPAGSTKKMDLSAKVTRRSIREQYDISDQYILDKFHRAIAFGEKEICSARSGLRSVCSVEASRLACETGETIFLSDVLS